MRRSTQRAQRTPTRTSSPDPADRFPATPRIPSVPKSCRMFYLIFSRLLFDGQSHRHHRRGFQPHLRVGDKRVDLNLGVLMTCRSDRSRRSARWSPRPRGSPARQCAASPASLPAWRSAYPGGGRPEANVTGTSLRFHARKSQPHLRRNRAQERHALRQMEIGVGEREGALAGTVYARKIEQTATSASVGVGQPAGGPAQFDAHRVDGVRADQQAARAGSDKGSARCGW